MTRQNCLVCVVSASAVWTGFPTTQDCRRQKMWSLNTFTAIVQFTSAHKTRHRQDRLVASGGQCELGRSQWPSGISASDCGVRGSRFESRRWQLCLSLAAAIYSLGHRLCTFTAVLRSTQPSTFRGTAKWVSVYGLSNNNNGDGGCGW